MATAINELRKRGGRRPVGPEVGVDEFSGSTNPLVRQVAINEAMNKLAPIGLPSDYAGLEQPPNPLKPITFAPSTGSPSDGLTPMERSANPGLRARGGMRPTGAEVGAGSLRVSKLRPMPTLAGIAPAADVQPQRGIFVGGRSWAPGQSTLPSPGYESPEGAEPVYGEASATGPGGLKRAVTADQVAAMAKAPVRGLAPRTEVSAGGGRLLATYRPGDAPAAQPGFRGQTISDLGPTARQRVAALAGTVGPRFNRPQSREERIAQIAADQAQGQGLELRRGQENVARIQGQAQVDVARAGAEQAGADRTAKSADAQADRDMQERIAGVKSGLSSGEGKLFDTAMASLDSDVLSLETELATAKKEAGRWTSEKEAEQIRAIETARNEAKRRKAALLDSILGQMRGGAPAAGGGGQSETVRAQIRAANPGKSDNELSPLFKKYGA